MKKVLVLSLLVVAAVVCTRKAEEPAVNVSVPPITSGELNTYRVLARDDSIGTHVTLVEHAWVEAGAVLCLTFTTRTTVDGTTTLDSTIINVNPMSLSPHSSFRFVESGSLFITTAANYVRKQPSMVAVTTFQGGEENQNLLPFIERNTFDNEQVTFLGRALKLKPDKPVEIIVVKPMGPPLGGDLQRGNFSLAGDETVTVPAGTFSCRKLVFEVGESAVELWYEKTGAHRLIRYYAPESDIVMELIPGVPS